MSSRPRPTVGLLALALGALLLAAGPAEGARRHVRLLRSVPAADSVITSAPARVQLWFSEALVLPVSRVRLERAGAAAVALTPLTRDSTVKDAPVTAPMPASLADGRYTVHWSTASADGHVVRGSFSFTLARR